LILPDVNVLVYAFSTAARLAALAIESGSEWITTDRDFARFPSLRWRHPLG
jgi:predicted nucleic acid-binding protein